MLGKTHTDESRKKISLTHKGRKLSEEQKRLGVNFLYVYEDKTCELIKYENKNIVRKIFNEVLY